MQILRVLMFTAALLWVGGSVVTMVAQAQSAEVLQERIEQHGRQLRSLEDMQLAERLTRLETQMTTIRDDIEQIKQIGLAVAGAIFLLLADKLIWIFSAMKGGKR